MNWYYAANGQQNGPVSELKFSELQRTGTITADTLVWREGMAEWLPFSQVRASESGTANSKRCSQCSRHFAEQDLIRLEGCYVCETCKPLFVQKLREGASLGDGAMWRRGKLLIATKDGVLPDRCVKCNEPVVGPKIRRRLYWHHPAVYVALLFNVLIFCIIAACVRKKATVMISVCDLHRAKRMKGIWIGIGMVLAGIVTFVCALAFSAHGAIAASGAILTLVGFVVWAVVGRYVYAHKIDPEHAWISGCGEEFLREFPEWER